MSRIHYIMFGGWAGLGAGVLSVVFELLTFPKSNLSFNIALVLSAIILAASTLVGLFLSAIAVLLLLGGKKLSQKIQFSRGAHGITAGLMTLGLMPAIHFLLLEMSTGRKASQILGSTVVRLVLTLLTSIIIGLCLWISLKVAYLIKTRRPQYLTLALGITLFALAVALFYADAFLYHGLYEYIHKVLLLGYYFAGLLACLVFGNFIFSIKKLFHSRNRPLPTWFFPTLLGVFLLIILIGGWSARRSLAQDQHLRYCALELSIVTDKILSFYPLEVRSEAPLFLEAVSTKSFRQKGAYRVPDANVIIVSIDALRPDHLSTYGYQRVTSPNIDALAARSARFESAYCQVPLTCYSVPSLHTGDYLRSTLPLLDKPPPTLARILAGRGYTTAAFYNSSLFFCNDQQAMSYGESRFGFDYTETALREAPVLTDQVLNYLQDFNTSGKRKLFLWVHYFDVHEPYENHPEYQFGQQNVDLYDSEIAYVDAAVGRLIAAVSQLPGPTIFILTSDHGEEFKEHGGYYHGSSLFEEQIRVPLIIGVPGLGPRSIQTPAQVVDIAPTVLSLLGQRIPESIRGHSLVPELLGKGDPDRTAFAEVHTKKMVRYKQLKLIHDFRHGTYEFYNLQHDPQERNNLIGRQPTQAQRLQILLNSWFDQIRAVATDLEKDRPEGIDLGRIGDRRAMPLLAKLVHNTEAKQKWRKEAARLLGQLQDASVADDLWQAVADDDAQVAAEAAVALGEVKDARAKLVLPQTMASTDLELRMRAAIALARVDGKDATPALIEALYSDNWEIQNRAAHYLGFVGDRRALDPLLQAARQFHLRPRLALTLGRIGTRIKDKRILPLLLNMVEESKHAETRQRALTGLGFLGDRKAIRPLARLLVEEPDLMWVPEALSRVGGIGSAWVPGIDFSTARQGLKEGWGICVNNASITSDDFKESTWCNTTALTAGIQVTWPKKPVSITLNLRLRSLDPKVNGSALNLWVNNGKLPSTKIHGGWQIIRLTTDAKFWKHGRNLLRLQLTLPNGVIPQTIPNYLAVDYLILLTPNARGAL